MVRNMTEGNPTKLILLFMLPLLIGNVFQQVYSMADAFIVGRTIGVNALAAIGATHGVTFLIIGFANGITLGMSIITAQQFGSGSEEGVRKSFACSVIIVIAGSVAVTALGLVFAYDLLCVLRTPPDIIEDTHRFLIIIITGIPATMAFNLLANVMRAVGNSRSPLIFLAIASLINIALDYITILVCKMGIAGAGISTVISQVVSAVLCAIYISKRMPMLRVSAANWKQAAAGIGEHLRMGLSCGFQTAIIGLGQLSVSFTLNGMGSGAVAATAAAQKIDGIGIMPLSAMGLTLGTYAAQNYGAGKIGRIYQGMKRCAIMAVSYSVVMALVNVLAGKYMVLLFLVNSPETARQAHLYLILNGIPYFIIAFMYIFRHTVQGLGNAIMPAVSGFVELFMRIVAAILLSRIWGYAGVCMANPLAWLGSCILMAFVFFSMAREFKKNTQDPKTN